MLCTCPRYSYTAKKPKSLEVRDINGLSPDQKVKTLADYFGTDGILNLAEPGLMPKRFENEIRKLNTHFGVPLTLTATEKERQLILRLSNAVSLEDIDSLVKSTPLVPLGPFSYFSVGLTKLLTLWQSRVLLDHNHKERWYQMNVYADLLDAAFLLDKNYNIKRTECHASTIKYLKKIKKIDNEQKNVHVDLIIFHHDYGDMFSCEDKAESVTERALQNDICKANNLREKRLLYLLSIIPHPSNIKHIEVLSAQFHGLTLTIYGSRMTELGNVIHYEKAQAVIPPSPFDHLSKAAHFFLTVMSLKKSIARNLKKLDIIFNTFLKDQIEYLTPHINNMVFREDSPGLGSLDEKGESDEWDIVERKRRIVVKIDKEISNLTFGENELTGDNWEDFIACQMHLFISFQLYRVLDHHHIVRSIKNCQKS